MKNHRQIPKMPEEYKGQIKKGCGYTASEPRTWTKEECDWVMKMKREGFSLKEIADSIGRTAVSVSVKLKRMSKEKDTYNLKHREQKYLFNRLFSEGMESVLDLYCGEQSYWKSNGFNATTNDINPKIDADYHEPAERLIHKLYYEGRSYDLIDLDPFGSPYECLDCAIKMAKKGLIVTFGELGHKRFKRLDFVRRHYGVENIDDFDLKPLVEEVIRIGKRNKKDLFPSIVGEWDRIARVYFYVHPLKITEQWNKNEK